MVVYEPTRETRNFGNPFGGNNSGQKNFRDVFENFQEYSFISGISREVAAIK